MKTSKIHPFSRFLQNQTCSFREDWSHSDNLWNSHRAIFNCYKKLSSPTKKWLLSKKHKLINWKDKLRKIDNIQRLWNKSTLFCWNQFNRFRKRLTFRNWSIRLAFCKISIKLWKKLQMIQLHLNSSNW